MSWSQEGTEQGACVTLNQAKPISNCLWYLLAMGPAWHAPADAWVCSNVFKWYAEVLLRSAEVC